MKPQDSLFNWPTRKDPPGTAKKPNLPIIVTPPSTSSRPLVQKKKRSKPSKTRCGDAAPPKLILHPDFWSQPQTDLKCARKTAIFTSHWGHVVGGTISDALPPVVQITLLVNVSIL